ncbi:MAG: ATP-dependent helicase [Nitrospirae bacterium]|nr:ATP-dependent helicase [Nitrospirota bacterium]
MFNPTAEQQKIIDHFNGHAIVVAGPGSGKTVTLIAHVNKLINDRNISPDDIWIMAFNRDISSKLREKIQNEIGSKIPQITTIHTFILKQTLKHGTQILGGFEIADGLGECGKENLLWKSIIKRLKEKHGIEKTLDNKRLDIRHVKGFLWNELRDYWLTSKKPNNNLFDKFNFEIERLKAIYKIIFLDELAIKFLDALKANPSFRQDVHKPRIVIDEFQDLNPAEHGILQQFHEEGTTFIVFGDDDQAVNDFRRAHADYIQDFTKIYKPEQYPLLRNRRCPKEILELADEFVKGLPRLKKLAGYASHKGKVDILDFDTDEVEQLEIANIVKKYLSLFQQYQDNPQILILCGTTGKVKGQSRIAEVIEILKNAEVNEVTGDKKEDPLDNEWGLAFKSLTAILVKGLTPMNIAAFLSVADFSLLKTVNEHIEEAERQGNRIDFLKTLSDLGKNNSSVEKLLSDIENLKEKIKDEKFNPDIIISFIKNSLDGKNDAEPFIKKVWEESQKKHEEKLSKGEQFLQLLNKYITEEIKKQEIGRVHVTTYRKSKGLEAELVIVTSVDSSDFFDQQQKRRLLYVAATRSKKNLILTFANKRSGARRFTRGRDKKFKGVPRVFRSHLIPSSYQTINYSEEWLKNWEPI